MPNLTVSSNVDTMLGAADNAAIRTAIGLGSTNSPSFSSINTTDRVGIGTTLPTSRLEVAFPTSLTGLNLVSAGTTSVSNFVTWSTPWGSLSGGIKSGPDNGWTTQIYSNQQLSFSAGGVDSSDLLISATGNVGIGTNAPSSKLHVVGGNILVDNYIQGQRVFSFMGSSTYAGMDTAGMFTNTGIIGFSANTSVNFTNSCDTFLLRDGAANTLALRNGGNAQTFNVYGTWSSITDYRRLSISCAQTTGNIDITANKGSGTTGVNGAISITTASALYLTGNTYFANSAGSASWRIDSNLFPQTNNAFDFGSAGLRVKSGYFGTSVVNAGYAEHAEMTAPAAPASNSVRIYAEDNGAGKTRLMALFATGVAQQIAIEP